MQTESVLLTQPESKEQSGVRITPRIKEISSIWLEDNLKNHQTRVQMLKKMISSGNYQANPHKLAQSLFP